MPADRFIQRHRTVVLLVSFLAPLVACALLALVRGAIDNTNAALILVLLVVAAASTGLRLAGLLAAASSAVWFDLFLTAPYGRLTINDRADIETTVLLIFVGVAVTEICLWGHRQQSRASRESGYLSGVLSAAEQIGTGSAPAAAVIEHVQQLIEGWTSTLRAFRRRRANRCPALSQTATLPLASTRSTSIVKACPPIQSCVWRFEMRALRMVSFD
jgi:K+-sensing histidine kinase KdpD